jgi:hypothetical protein
MKLWRTVASAAVLVVAAAACTPVASQRSSAPRADATATEPVEAITGAASEVALSALEDPAAPGLPEPLVDPSEIISGGPPPDGIPPIDDPQFVDAAAVDFLEPDELVLALEIDGDARAYPIQIMVWHEIVNDTVGDVPVAVTYCPLCNSAVAMDRRVRDRVLDFGTSGKLYQSALVMYDRQTESLWSHFTGEAIAGTLTSETLEFFPVATVAWEDWKTANPQGTVLTRETGVSRDYGRNPYVGYDTYSQSRPFAFEGDIDARLEPKTKIVGILLDGQALAVVHDTLVQRRVMQVGADEENLVVWLKPGAASPLDRESVAGGRDVGASGVFVAEARGSALTFMPSRGGFRDRETGSQWNVLGKAVGGPLAGERLEPVTHLDTFWFAWAAFQPDTRILR